MKSTAGRRAKQPRAKLLTSTTQQKLTCLLSLVRFRERWHNTFQSLKRMHQWILETKRILAAEWGEPNEILSSAQVAQRFDRWISDWSIWSREGS
jgi:hypothetical protein